MVVDNFKAIGFYVGSNEPKAKMVGTQQRAPTNATCDGWSLWLFGRAEPVKCGSKLMELILACIRKKSMGRYLSSLLLVRSMDLT